MEIVTSWMEQGIERGIERGFILGELEIIKRQIKVQIGEISPQLIDKISKLPSHKLEDLSEALLDFSAEENLAAWLQENAEDSTEYESGARQFCKNIAIRLGVVKN